MRRCLDKSIRRGICFKEEVPRPRRKEGIGKEAILLNDIGGRQPRDGTDIGKDIGSEWLCRTRGKLPSRADDALYQSLFPLIHNAVCRKGIGLDCVRPRV